MRKILVTGVLGFIGSYFAKYAISTCEDVSIVGVGRNTDQHNLRRINEIMSNPRFKLVYCDIARDDVTELFEDVDYAINFAAKTFVDHSIRDPEPFIQSNIVGLYKLLEEARKSLQLEKFIVIGTDEEYGSIAEGSHTELSSLNPKNPYSASKAAGSMLALSYHNTYGVPIILTRSENVYGPYQHPQKVIPMFVRKALNDEPLPVYGTGEQVRQWLHVEDKCRALLTLLDNGRTGEIYNIAGSQELRNIDLAKMILRFLDKPEDLIEFVDDTKIRPGHDFRYAISNQKLLRLGWKPEFTLESGIRDNVEWYRDNRWWLL